MAKVRQLNPDQLAIPFIEVLKDMDVISKEHAFDKLKKLFLPNSPLSKYPLFLQSKSKVVSDSRKRWQHIITKQDGEAPDMKMSDLVFKNRELTIKADPDYGFPDEFDGSVFDCLIMLISKEYLDKDAVFKGYCFSETDIMLELTKQGYSRGGSLYERIKSSLDRMYFTNYILKDEKTGKNKSTSYYEVLYRLIDGIFRKGESIKTEDGEELAVDKTVILPNGSFLNAIEEKKFFIVGNEKRYKLKRYLTKQIYDYLTKSTYNIITSKDLLVARAASLRIPFVVGYDTFCSKTGFFGPSEKELRPGKIIQKLKSNIDDLKNNNVICEVFVEPKAKRKKEFNMIFVLHDDFIQTILDMVQPYLLNKDISEVKPDDIKRYMQKIQTQIKSKKIVEFLKSVTEKAV